MMNRLADWFVRHRGLVGITVGVLAAISLWGVSRIKINDVPRDFFYSNAPEFEDLATLYRDFGSEDNDCILVIDRSSVFTPESADRPTRGFLLSYRSDS